jgi:hypothetical protein
MLPGSQPRRVSKILINKVGPNPTVRKTPKGGKNKPRSIRNKFMDISYF